MDEIYRSFHTLKLIEDNPSVLGKLTDMNSDLSVPLNDNARERHRRQLETATTSTGQSDSDTPSDNGHYLGPYSYPMFSGIPTHVFCT